MVSQYRLKAQWLIRWGVDLKNLCEDRVPPKLQEVICVFSFLSNSATQCAETRVQFFPDPVFCRSSWKHCSFLCLNKCGCFAVPSWSSSNATAVRSRSQATFPRGQTDVHGFSAASTTWRRKDDAWRRHGDMTPRWRHDADMTLKGDKSRLSLSEQAARRNIFVDIVVQIYFHKQDYKRS